MFEVCLFDSRSIGERHGGFWRTHSPTPAETIPYLPSAPSFHPLLSRPSSADSRATISLHAQRFVFSFSTVSQHCRPELVGFKPFHNTLVCLLQLSCRVVGHVRSINHFTFLDLVYLGILPTDTLDVLYYTLPGPALVLIYGKLIAFVGIFGDAS